MSTFIPKDQIPHSIASEILFDNFVQLRRDTLVNGDGRTSDYYTLGTRSSAAVILARDSEGSFVVNWEYRHPTKKVLLSLPGGYLEKGEEPCYGGARELFEETGYKANRLICMGAAYPYPGISDQKLYYILALEAYCAGPTEREAGELIHTTLMTVSELKEAIQGEEAVDGNLCTALYFYGMGDYASL